MSQSNGLAAPVKRSYRVMLAITRGDTFRTYTVRPTRAGPGERLAWCLTKQGEGTCYRLAVSVGGVLSCDCPGFAEHHNCKHSDWAVHFGLWLGLELTHAEGEIKVAASERDAARAEARQLRADLDDANNRLRQMDELLAEATRHHTATASPNLGPEPPREIAAGGLARWHRRGSVPLTVTVEHVAANKARCLLPDGSHRTVALTRLSPEEPPF